MDSHRWQLVARLSPAAGASEESSGPTRPADVGRCRRRRLAWSWPAAASVLVLKRLLVVEPVVPLVHLLRPDGPGLPRPPVPAVVLALGLPQTGAHTAKRLAGSQAHTIQARAGRWRHGGHKLAGG
jgi:hypothetical protein